MRTTLKELYEAHQTLGDETFVERFGTAFFVADPKSAFNIPQGPKETMRIDVSAVQAAHRGEFHISSPAFLVRRRSDSPYSFISVGRTENCDVHLPDESVSKLHAIIRSRNGALTVQDAGSANGTFIGDAPVNTREQGGPTELKPGDIVRFGSIKLHVVDIPGLVRLAASASG